MSTPLGRVPDQVVVHLQPDADFVCRLTRADGDDWEPGTSIALVLTGMKDRTAAITWGAVIAGPDAEWAVPAAQVAAVCAAAPQQARLMYDDGAAGPVLWAKGTVRVD